MKIANADQYQLIAALFLRLMGLFYLIAFASLLVQVEALVGSQGIDPLAEKLARVAPEAGLAHYFRYPTLFWISASDAALSGAAVAGCILAVLIMLNRWQRLALLSAFLLYLSLYHACQVFLNFQWDGLLLEAGFLAIFLTPGSRLVVWLFRWLLFRLRFMSGLSKIVTQDEHWSGLTALHHYFEVQPLPSPLAWYFHHLPDALLRFGTAATLVIELLVPFMMFLSRPWRFTAAWLTILWQLLIILSSNHNWFNFLTIALCLFLFDDAAVKRVLPKRMVEPILAGNPVPRATFSRKLGLGLLTGFILIASGGHLWEMVRMEPVSGLAGKLLDSAESWRVVSSYHVFGSMKSERIELEISGSVDGISWKPYVFKYKPGDVYQRPAFVIPHQPRLDWQMWFVTLHPRHMPWFADFLQALLMGSPRVISLMKEDPFSGEAPRYLRVEAYRYHFASTTLHAETGQWWTREFLGPFQPLPFLQRSDSE